MDATKWQHLQSNITNQKLHVDWKLRYEEQKYSTLSKDQTDSLQRGELLKSAKYQVIRNNGKATLLHAEIANTMETAKGETSCSTQNLQGKCKNIEDLKSEIKDLKHENEQLKITIRAKETNFKSELRKQADLYAKDLFALQKCKENLKYEKNKGKKLENEMSLKELECKKLNDQMVVMHEAFSQTKDEIATGKMCHMQGLHSEERQKYEEKIYQLNEMLRNHQTPFCYKEEKHKDEYEDKWNQTGNRKNLQGMIEEGLHLEETRRYEEQIKNQNLSLESYEAIAENHKNLISHLEAVVQKMTTEKMESEEKLYAATRKIHDMVEKDAATSREIESIKYNLYASSEDFNQERRKNNKLEMAIEEKNSRIENEQRKCTELWQLLEKKEISLQTLKKNCNALETDVTQLMNELRQLEGELEK